MKCDNLEEGIQSTFVKQIIDSIGIDVEEEFSKIWLIHMAL